MSLSSGAKLGPYEVVGPMGAGGMAESSKATSQTVKIMRHGAAKEQPESLAREDTSRSRSRTIPTLTFW
jgi:hypothetical protein